MHPIPFGAWPCLLMVQAAAPAPLSYATIERQARPAPDVSRADALLAERQALLHESRGFLREGPTLSASAGPRRAPGGASTLDRAVDLDLPLFLSPGVRSGLEAKLGQAHPLLQEAARREARLRLRAAYLDAWLAARMLALRESDLGTVEGWLKAAQARLEAGADPAFQVTLVEGERLKVHQELDAARAQAFQAWATLLALAEVPASPVPLEEPGPVPQVSLEDLPARLAAGPLRRALVAQGELEAQSLRLKEAQALSRWSLRGSYAEEGDEKVGRIGVAVRLPRPGESSGIQRATEAQIQALQGETRRALAELDARALAAVSRLQRAAGSAPPPDFTQALAAVGLRIQEGREKPSEALPIRRQLLDGQMAALRHQHAQHLLAAELQALLPEVTP